MFEEDENFSADDASSFKSILLNLYSKSQVDEMIKEEIGEVAEEYEWDGEEYEEYKNQKAWYDDQVKTIGHQAESNVLEKIMESVLEEMGVNTRRMEADLYETYQDVIKQEFKALDVEDEE